MAACTPAGHAWGMPAMPAQVAAAGTTGKPDQGGAQRRAEYYAGMIKTDVRDTQGATSEDMLVRNLQLAGERAGWCVRVRSRSSRGVHCTTPPSSCTPSAHKHAPLSLCLEHCRIRHSRSGAAGWRVPSIQRGPVTTIGWGGGRHAISSGGFQGRPGGGRLRPPQAAADEGPRASLGRHL